MDDRPLQCPTCGFLLHDPATAPCGHSFCRRCCSGFLPPRCPLCGERLGRRGEAAAGSGVAGRSTTVLAARVLEKCHPEGTRARDRIRSKIRERAFAEALVVADEAIRSAPEDLSLRIYRTEANLGLERLSDALEDLNHLCCLRPNWTEGFFLKGNVLLELGRQTEALIQFHRCLTLQADLVPAKSQIKKILRAEGMAVPEEVPRILQVVSDFLKEPCPITSLSDPRGPANSDGRMAGEEGDEEGARAANQSSRVKPGGSSTECCLSLCQAVSFLPTPDEDEEMMTRKEERQGQGEPGRGSDKTLAVLSVSDFECPLCIRLFHEPVTTPCGHTFCKNCTKRSLDHNLRCPLCKQPLQEYFEERKFNTTVLLQDIMTHLFPAELEERRRVDEAEMAELSNLTKDIPIFVCTVAYPGVRCPLHIFEPRYRLMMRRCMETGTKKFGMCSFDHGKGFSDYGCILEIHSLKVLPDGRSFVDAVGGSRFRVLRRSQRDGYHTADIECLEDLKAEGAELELLQHLHDSVYQQAQEWYQRLGNRIRERIETQYGAMPEKEDNIQASSNGPAWCWWLLSVLQLDPAYQTTVLSLTSLKDRLSHLRLALEYFSQS